MIKLYVGHEVISRKRYTKFGYQNNSTSCYFSNYYFVSKKCVLLQRDKNGNYLYLGSQNKCRVIDPNDLEVSTNILGCNQCNMKKNDGMKCDLNAETPINFLGVLDIQPIESFTKTSDISLALSLLKNYNSQINDNDEFVYIDDMKYVDTIREIDNNIYQNNFKKLQKKQ